MTHENKPPVIRAEDRVDYAPPERFPAASDLLDTLRDLRPAALVQGYKLLLTECDADEAVIYSQALRLLRLAEYLMLLPNDYEQFCMEDYATNPYYRGRKPVKCGTAACALGHAPYAVGAPRRLNSSKTETWESYAIRVFGDLDPDPYYFFFGGGWGDYDNSPVGAASRILYLVERAVLLTLVEEGSEKSDLKLDRILTRTSMSLSLQRYEHLKKLGVATLEDSARLATRLEPDPALYEAVL